MTNPHQNPQGNGSQTSSEGQGFGQRVDQIGSEAQHLWSNARSAVTDLGETLDLKGRVDRNPYGMMAAALGVGYILGGGLFTPLTARILKLGVRLAALPFVKDELLGMAEAALHGYQAGQSSVGGQSGADQAPAAGVGTSPRTGGPGNNS
ncbi:MAG: hypothetical protein JXB05_31000 [Myxococcaceae bacterium]|nr:hypothetical protein [Myxococcaceae bacterium]